ncbi:MAG: L-glutamate gamma-semialdehyde dehydrogenase [Deltaproteobacteria bacterium RIFCSPLOWO2_02_FULL_47_10]|nr:MAG: L-glutamate gamma-semialdehyde dehydrogenase [Deltaproteobacteria bacterium RIFCSPLOWO2_02_FULL_47_10]
MVTDFKNESLADFSRPETVRQMQEALEYVKSQLGAEYPLIIGEERIKTKDKIRSCNPANPAEVVGIVQLAGVEDGAKAIETAAKAFESWRWAPEEERADRLFHAAQVIKRRKFELAAWMVYEVGKSWAEADGDVCEAIDFCEFYAREALRYAEVQPCLHWPGEHDIMVYIPLGVGVVIPPWNFPFAILVGMACAAWVTGNTVVLKPSSDAPVIAAKFMEVIEEIGLPPGVVNFVSGGGGSIGDSLVSNPKTRFISFTGSKAVGLHIIELASKMQKGQKWIKRVVAEMGGKDAIIVDNEADMDSAAAAVVSSAFGFQGQKCSACSRAIIVEDVYDTMVDKIIEKAKTITVGPTVMQKNYMGPVVNKKAYEAILNYIEIGKKEGRLACGGSPCHSCESRNPVRSRDPRSGGDDSVGYFIQPTIIADVKPGARIEQEEIFGPVLAIIKARNFDHAIEIANDTEYGLTGAVYTKNIKKIEQAKLKFHTGNLYINRKCTGAMVACHPFGGFNMSGTCSKAGGRDYLFLFLQSKSISEVVGRGIVGRP